MNTVCPAVTLRTRLLQVVTAVTVVLQIVGAVTILGAFFYLPVVLLLACLEIIPFPSEKQFMNMFCLQLIVFELTMRNIAWLLKLMRNRRAV